MGLGCGEIAGGGVSAGIWFVKVFNTGDDGGGCVCVGVDACVCVGGGVCSRHPQQVWTNRRSPGMEEGSALFHRPPPFLGI